MVALRLFTTTLKNLAVELNSFISTSTQISFPDNKKDGFKDFSYIQGSRAICNLVDLACIASEPSPEELNMVSGFYNNFGYQPNFVIDVFKNRRGRWKNVRIWCLVDLGTCRRKDLFITTSKMKEVQGFQVISFMEQDQTENNELLKLYNTGEVNEELLEQILDKLEEIEETPINYSEVFDNEQDLKKRYENVDFGDLL